MAITKHEAQTVGMFFHIRLRNADGSAVRCRANGACKTWKTRPDDYRLPVKYGLRQCFYLTPSNAHEWLVYDPTDKAHIDLCGKLGLSPDAPRGIIRDAMIDTGMIDG